MAKDITQRLPPGRELHACKDPIREYIPTMISSLTFKLQNEPLHKQNCSPCPYCLVSDGICVTESPWFTRRQIHNQMEGNQIYTVPSSSIGYPQCITPLQGNPYHQRRRSPHPHRQRESLQQEESKRRKRERTTRQREPEKEKEITEEELDKTYTGLDREIAEEFISIAMTNPESSSKNSEMNKEDRVIDYIASM